MRPGFWEMMFDSEYRQRTDINEALAMEQHMSNDISVLHAQVRALQDHVRDLSVTVAAMLEILVEQHHSIRVRYASAPRRCSRSCRSRRPHRRRRRRSRTPGRRRSTPPR